MKSQHNDLLLHDVVIEFLQPCQIREVRGEESIRITL